MFANTKDTYTLQPRLRTLIDETYVLVIGFFIAFVHVLEANVLADMFHLSRRLYEQLRPLDVLRKEISRVLQYDI